MILERLLLNHNKRNDLVSEYAKLNAGFKGEESLDYYLADLKDKSFSIFHDLRLPRDKDRKYYFQIDCLVIHHRFCVLLEVKNLIGDLYFDHQYDQIKRSRNGIEETFSDPVNQVEIQKDYLSNWLKVNNFPALPLKTLVVITNAKSYITISPKYGRNARKIIRGKYLVSKIMEYLHMNNGIELSNNEIRKLSSILLKQHTELNSDILRRYKIQPQDIKTGVACPKCGEIPMIRRYGYWFCSDCSLKSKDAHIQAIKEYALLFKQVVKNKEIREFLHVKSSTSMKKLLISMKILPKGNTNSATYKLPLPK
jgi:ribosomal protein L37AE/L43A